METVAIEQTTDLEVVEVIVVVEETVQQITKYNVTDVMAIITEQNTVWLRKTNEGITRSTHY